MNINDISSNESQIKVKKRLSMSGRKKMIILGAVIILVVIAAILLIKFINGKMMYNKYAKGLVSNKGLHLVESRNMWEIYRDDASRVLYGFSVGACSFPYFNDTIVNANIVDSVGYDDNDKLITKSRISINYNVYRDKRIEYTVDIDELSPNGAGNSTASMSGSFKVTKDLEVISAKGSNENVPVSEESAKAMFEKHRDEVRDRMDKLFQFFGEENFYKQTH